MAKKRKGALLCLLLLVVSVGVIYWASHKRTIRPRVLVQGPMYAITAIRFTPDGGTIITGTSEQFDGPRGASTLPHGVRFWDSADGREKESFLYSAGPHPALAVSPDG